MFHKNGIEVLDWPPNSQDLNLIEELRRTAKMKITAAESRTPTQLGAKKERGRHENFYLTLIRPRNFTP
jgi:hypothetical protein